MKKRTVQNLYTSMTEECISITSSLLNSRAILIVKEKIA